MSWQGELREAAEAARERRGRLQPWWVKFDKDCDRLWATTPESGEGWTLCAIARTLYAMGRTFEVAESTDPKQALVRFEPQEYLAVDESDMALVMQAVRRSGHHGTYRKAGTEKEYRF